MIDRIRAMANRGHENAGDTGCHGACEHLGAIAIERGNVEVAVRVDHDTV
jgi:hypothetical protein